MRSGKIYLFFVVFIMSLTVVLTPASPKSKETDHLSLCKEIYGFLQSFENGEYSASVQNMIGSVSYTNAKITDKYRASAILDYVEKNPFDATAENIRSDLTDIFGSCKMYKSDEFYECISQIYNNYLAKSETEFASGKDFGEAFVKSNFLSSERKTFHGFYTADGKKLADGATAIPFYRLENIKKSAGELMEALCFKGCGSKGAVSPKGEIWLGGNNYLFSFSAEAPPAGKDERPDIMLLCKPTSGAEGSLSSFDNRVLFERKGVKTENLTSDSVFEIFEICPLNSSCEGICGERDVSSGFLAFDFSLYSEKKKR